MGLVGIGAMLGIVLGVVALVKARNAPTEYGGKGSAVAGIAPSPLSILVIPVLGIIAALALPSLLPAPVSPHEAPAPGDGRSAGSAGAAFSFPHQGHDTS